MRTDKIFDLFQEKANQLLLDNSDYSEINYRKRKQKTYDK